MTSNEMRATPSDLTAVAQFSDGVADQLVNRYLQTSESVAALLDGQWKGSAAEACSRTWQEWSDGFRLVVAGLRDEAMAMQTAAEQYVATDETAAAWIADT